METKLTLKLDKRIINQAKAYAKRHHKSLSGLVENYFKNLTDLQQNEKAELSPPVRELSGVLKLKPDFVLNKDYLAHLEERHK